MKRVSQNIYKVILAFMVLWGARAWFLWWIDYNASTRLVVYLTILVITILYKFSNKIKLSINNRTIFGFVCLFVGILCTGKNINGMTEACIQYIPFMVLISDKRNNGAYLSFITRLLSIIILAGIIPFLLYLIGVDILPSFAIRYGEDIRSYVFENHFLFLINSFHVVDIPRFQSIFLEPGYLGTLVSFMLFLNHYDFKNKWNIPLVIGLVLSMSLAAYLSFFIGYILYLRESNKSYLRILLWGGLVFISILVAPLINNGDNIYNQRIVSRLEIDEEKGITGNNRFHGDTDFLFERAISDGTILWGLDKNTFKNADISGAGYKIYMLQNGLISYVFMMLFYFMLASGAKNKRHMLNASIILFLIFLQATTPGSYRWLVPFALSLRYS